MADQKSSRRAFLKLAATSTAAAGLAPAVLAGPRAHPLAPPQRPIAPSDRVRIATIGMGIMGIGDTRTALRVPGVELVGVADAYDGRLVRARELFGKDLVVTRAYEELLGRADVDAVIVAVPDHLHAQIGIAAMEAGKHVYLEKPMVQDIEEGPRVIEAQQRTGRVVQVGSQRVSSIVGAKAKALYEQGAIGRLNMVEAYMNRNSSTGAWQYTLPLDASPETIAWDRFIGPAPRRPFDPVRFFRWRNYWDYGTGVPGDLFVHLFSGIHHVLGSHGPTRVSSSGGLRFWKDGRDAPDVMAGLYEYPEAATHPAFTCVMQVNFANGGGSGDMFRFIGDEGVIEVGTQGMKLSRLPERRLTEGELKGWNTLHTYPEAMQQQLLEQFRAQTAARGPRREGSEEVFEAPRGYDDRLDHLQNFFDAVRAGKPEAAVEGVVFGYRAAAPALLSNLSYRENRVVSWDPDNMLLLS